MDTARGCLSYSSPGPGNYCSLFQRTGVAHRGGGLFRETEMELPEMASGNPDSSATDHTLGWSQPQPQGTF